MPDATSPAGSVTTPELKTGRPGIAAGSPRPTASPSAPVHGQSWAPGRMAACVCGGRKGVLPRRASHHADAPALGGARVDDCLRDGDRSHGADAGDQGQPGQSFFKGLAIIPLRYALVVMELVTLARFASDLWITKNRNWRK